MLHYQLQQKTEPLVPVHCICGRRRKHDTLKNELRLYLMSFVIQTPNQKPQHQHKEYQVLTKQNTKLQPRPQLT